MLFLAILGIFCIFEVSGGVESTAPTLKGDLIFFLWGPNGDLIFSEMGTKWGPSTSEMVTQKAYISKIERNEPMH